MFRELEFYEAAVGDLNLPANSGHSTLVKDDELSVSTIPHSRHWQTAGMGVRIVALSGQAGVLRQQGQLSSSTFADVRVPQVWRRDPALRLYHRGAGRARDPRASG